MLGKLVDGVKGTISEIVQLKKFETASPEDRVALMAQQQAQPDATGQSSLVPEPSAAAAMPAASPKPAEAAPTASGIPSALNVEQLMRESMRSPVAQLIFSEWARALRANGDPSMFANTFMEWMKDESPSGAEARKGCSMFAQIMDIRDWSEMKALIVQALPADFRSAFDLPNAEGFYNAFKLLVCELVKDFFRAYLDQKRAEILARQNAQQPVKPAGGNGSKPAAAASEPEVRISEPEAPEVQEEEKPSEAVVDPA
jgi:hypothetical protein